MIEQLICWDKLLLLYLNGMHTPFWDTFMYLISDKYIWIPFYVFLLLLIIKNYRLRTIDVIIAVVVLIAISDLTSVHCFKEVFQRLRPCHDPAIKPYVHLFYGKCGGLYGFVSSHAANTFALCFFLINITGKKIKYLSISLIIWASVVSLSRIYLGAHFPLDVLCGALLGIFTGITVGKAFNYYYKRFVLKNQIPEKP